MPFGDAVLGQALDETIAGKFDMLWGRRTYEIFASCWPHQGHSIAKAFNNSAAPSIGSSRARRNSRCPRRRFRAAPPSSVPAA